MSTLKAEKRDMSVKAKKLRREGIIPGCLFGRGMEESMPLQFSVMDATRFMKSNKKGSRVTLDIEGKTVNALCKEIDFDALKKQILSFDFQALVAGEKVHASVPIVMVNEDKIKGYVISQQLSEINYKAAPEDLIDQIEVDLTAYPEGESIRICDLEALKNDKIEISHAPEDIIIHITDHVKSMDEPEEVAEAGAVDGETDEAPAEETEKAKED